MVEYNEVPKREHTQKLHSCPRVLSQQLVKGQAVGPQHMAEDLL